MNILLTLFFILLVWLIIDFINKNKKKNNEPNGPWALPLIGNLHLLGNSPQISLRDLSIKYGGIYKIWLGDHPTFVVTDPNLIKSIWIKNNSNFINRPHNKSFSIFSNNFKGISFVDKDEWKVTRRLVSHAFTKTKIKIISNVLDKQTKKIIEEMDKFEKSNSTYYIYKDIRTFSMNIMLDIVYSKEIKPQDIVLSKCIDNCHCITNAMAAGNIGDVLSIFSPISNLSKSNTQFKKQMDEIRSYVNNLYDDLKQTLNPENPRNLFDQMIIASDNNDYKDSIVQAGIDFLIAGTDTVSNTTEWFLIYMANNPEIQDKAFNELMNAVENNQGQYITINEKSKTPYLNCIIKEVMRIRPVVPLGLPRETLVDTTVDGYFFPKGTRLLQNVYGMCNNESFVSDHNEFKPERFLLSGDGVNNLDKIVIPFSVGPRNCVGEPLASHEIYLLFSNILMNFKVRPIDGITTIDTTEVFGLTLYPKDPLPIKLTSRKQ